ncbi:aminoglycoside phosphotransferase family protein [Aspergillus fumigatus Af293]|uniref:Aminoglycoside phosphotransferase domain-containing protein n=1 Tax=Aspergillus fumigatus (strain ATCC MYA-4609 / CBS 101355 / FGSC A1100 / Af293) TaxID=330879 RepID=Q4WQX1_ASPFU|nr:conserved hypothetical protein [Aspergillus fumigatus Af293]EAL89363.1 conserved hypothetical protein [Aspergillus fumigatus Af293]
MKIFPESSFFKERRAHALPSPADIRAINEGSGNASVTSFNCPPLVMIPWLGLVVKYSADVTIIKAQTQMMLQNRVPVPEVFGWAEDANQIFLYMQFIEGETLIARWGSLDEDERRAICEELRGYLKMIRSLEQDLYIGSLGNRPLNDIFLKNHPDLVGPFLGKNAVKQFHSSCGIEISCKTHVVFTHNDLLPPNIIISPGQSPKVAAIVDWAQAGWYPAYWEYCKAWWVRVNPTHFNDAFQEDWRVKYLPMILDPMDDETYYHPWLYFVLSKGI